MGDISSKLILRRCVLGAEAADGEMNVIEAETLSMDDLIKIPIAILKVGETRQENLGELEFFNPPVTFRLIKGKGPVHIMGQHLQQDEEEPLADMEEFAEDEDEDLEDEEHEIKADDGGNPKKKIKLSKNHKDGKKSKNDKGK